MGRSVNYGTTGGTVRLPRSRGGLIAMFVDYTLRSVMAKIGFVNAGMLVDSDDDETASRISPSVTHKTLSAHLFTFWSFMVKIS